MQTLKYIRHYPEHLQAQVQSLIKEEKLGDFLRAKYPHPHDIKTDKALYTYVNALKNSYLKKFPPLSKVMYDGKINVIDNALGAHTFVSRVQGNKLKAKNEIRIASLFKQVPEAFLEMIVVHELAHYKEKEHNKAFYQFCTYMLSDYHQKEFELRLYLTHLDLFGKVYT